MKLSTRATITSAAATALAGAAYLETRYLAIAVFTLVVLAAIGWPMLLRISHQWVGTGVVIGGGALGLVAVLLGGSEPYLRYLIIAIAAVTIGALVAEIFFPSEPGRAVTSVAATASAGAVAVAGAAWVAADRTPGAEDLVVAGSAALAVAAIASVLTHNAELNAALTVVAAGAIGYGTGYVFDSISWWGGIVVGIVAAASSLLVHELTRREPPPVNAWAGISSALTPVLMTGILVYIAGRLLVG